MFILVALLCELDLCKWKVFHKTIDKRWGKKTKKKKNFTFLQPFTLTMFPLGIKADLNHIK